MKRAVEHDAHPRAPVVSKSPHLRSFRALELLIAVSFR